MADGIEISLPVANVMGPVVALQHGSHVAYRQRGPGMQWQIPGKHVGTPPRDGLQSPNLQDRIRIRTGTDAGQTTTCPPQVAVGERVGSIGIKGAGELLSKSQVNCLGRGCVPQGAAATLQGLQGLGPFSIVDGQLQCLLICALCRRQITDRKFLLFAPTQGGRKGGAAVKQYGGQHQWLGEFSRFAQNEDKLHLREFGPCAAGLDTIEGGLQMGLEGRLNRRQTQAKIGKGATLFVENGP